MSDYQKLNVRFANKGLNLVKTQTSIDFGEYTYLKNVVSQIEGELTARTGVSIMDNTALSSTSILGIQRINDSVNGKSTYICKAANGKWYITVDGSSKASTVVPFDFYDTTLSAGSSVFGSFVIERPPKSSGVFTYIGDRSAMYKLGLDATGGIIIKNIGIARPNGPPTMAQTTSGSLTLLATYYYRYTLFDKNTGTESLFNYHDNATDSTVTSSITLTGSNNKVNITIPLETVDAATTHVRIYRKGGNNSVWARISDDSATYAYTGASVVIADTASDISIASSTLIDDVSDKPFSITQTDATVLAGQALPYLFGPYLGYVLGTGDPLNPGFVYWANKYEPDMQDPANNVEVTSPQDPIQNGVIYEGKPYIFSKSALYALYTGLDSTSTFVPSKTSCNRGLWTPHAVVAGPQIYFLGNDGIYATSGGIEQALTDNELRPLFDPDSSATTVNGIGCVDYAQTSYMFMAYHRNEVHFQYMGKDSNTHVIAFDVRYHRWRHWQGGLGANIRCIYTDEQTTPNMLLGAVDGNLYQDNGANDGGVAITCEVKTGLITLGAPLIHKEFGALYLDVNPKGATVSISAYANRGATLIGTTTTSAASRTRVYINLADTFSEDLQIDFSWSSSTVAPILYGYELLYRPEVTQLSKWSITGVTHGLLGWQILRSGYFTLRCDGTVNFNITYDTNPGAAYQYTIASTSGGKKKIFIPFDPIKAKLFSYSLTLGTATYFRFYPEESELHVKPWVSSMGYTVANPFAGGSQDGIGTSQDGGSTNVSGMGGDGGGGSSFNGGGGGSLPAFDFTGIGGGMNIGPQTNDGVDENGWPIGQPIPHEPTSPNGNVWINTAPGTWQYMPPGTPSYSGE